MKHLFFILLFPILLQAQSKAVRLLLNDDDKILQTETTTFLNRVKADGGTTLDAAFTDQLIALLKTQGCYTNLVFGVDPNCGYKLATGVSKLYNIPNSNDLVQATTTNQPAIQTYIDNTSATSSLKSLLFNGSSNYLKSPSIALNYPETIFFVVRQTTWTNNKSMLDGYSGVSVLLYQNPSTPQVGFIAGGTQKSLTGFSVGTMGVLTAIENGASSSIQLNRGTAITGSVGTNNAGGLTIGARGDATFPSNIEVGTVLVFNSVLNNSQITAILTVLLNRWKL